MNGPFAVVVIHVLQILEDHRAVICNPTVSLVGDSRRASRKRLCPPAPLETMTLLRGEGPRRRLQR